MQRSTGLLLFILLCATEAANAATPLPHLDLEMTGTEYRALSLAQHHQSLFTGDELDPLVEMGKRNLDWLIWINDHRPADQKLELTTPATMSGIPIEAPRETSREIIMQRWAAFQQNLPQAMQDVLIAHADFPLTLPVDDTNYLTWAREADKIYQTATRWLLTEPNLIAYAGLAKRDIRGYYYLNKEPELTSKLQDFHALVSSDQLRLKEYLIGQCFNGSKSQKACTLELSGLLQKQSDVTSYFNKYRSIAEKTWNDYFLIAAQRNDVSWSSSDSSIMTVPFLDPGNSVILSYLRDNIEDEWRWGKWSLKLDFRASGFDLTHVVFQEGVTPHVNGLAGNEIIMDANLPTQEWDSRWTIRHEYGHTLGFPDCYVEFYDEPRKMMVSYQLDISNLMCSRRGKLQQTHFEELKRVYFQ